MTAPNETEAAERPLSRDILDYCRARIVGRRGLLILAAAGVFAGIALNWSWLVAAGIAPILIAVLPCLAMCGIGMCMNKLTGGSCEQQSSAGDSHRPSAAAPRQSRAVSGSGAVPVVRPRPLSRSRKRPARKRQTRKSTEAS